MGGGSGEMLCGGGVELLLQKGVDGQVVVSCCLTAWSMCSCGVGSVVGGFIGGDFIGG